MQTLAQFLTDFYEELESSAEKHDANQKSIIDAIGKVAADVNSGSADVTKSVDTLSNLVSDFSDLLLKALVAMAGQIGTVSDQSKAMAAQVDQLFRFTFGEPTPPVILPLPGFGSLAEVDQVDSPTRPVL